MRAPELHADGWELDDGEKLHAESPATFQIPHEQVRNVLQPGDFAKLVFCIAVSGETEPRRERMWVIVRARLEKGYLGILDNDPDCIERNDAFWSGIELPFEPRHIIDVQHSNSDSVALAARSVSRPWQ